MGKNVPCPVCTLYLHPGMNLAEHLETHPKEQVIKALVNLAIFKDGNTKKDTPSTSTSEHKHPNTSMNAELELSPCNTLLEPSEPSLKSPSTSLANGTTVHPENHLPTPTADKMSISSVCGSHFNAEPKHISNGKRQPSAALIDHHISNVNCIQQTNRVPMDSLSSSYQSGQSLGLRMTSGQSQMFSYQPISKPLQPPPEYGAAISQLRSQSSQNFLNSGRKLVQMNYGSSFESASSVLPLHHSSQQTSGSQCTLDFSISKNITQMRPVSNMTFSEFSPATANRQVNSPRLTASSPSVLRYADSPVTAQYVERDNGDFLVQEIPKHVVECVERDDGEFSVVEKVISSPPSIVQINETEHLQDAPKDMSHKEETTETQVNEIPSENKCEITVLSDVQLDVNEYLDLVGNILASSQSSNAGEIQEKSAIDNCEKEIPHATSASSKSATTSVIRLAASTTKTGTTLNGQPKPGPSTSCQGETVSCQGETATCTDLRIGKKFPIKKECEENSSSINEPSVTFAKRAVKKGPKKLIIKSKLTTTSSNCTNKTKTSTSDKTEKTERFSPLPGPSGLSQEERTLKPNSDNSSAMKNDQGECQQLDEMDIKLDCTIHEDTILDPNLDKNLLMDIPIICLNYDMSSNYNNDSSSIHVNFPTSSSSVDGSKRSTSPETEMAKCDVKDSQFKSVLENCLKSEKDNEAVEKKYVLSNSEPGSLSNAQSFPSSSLFSKPSTSSAALRSDANTENEPPTTNFVDYPFSYLYASPQQMQSPCDEEHVFNKGNRPVFQSQINEYEDEEKNCYLDLDACKMGSSIQDSLSMAVALNIQTDEKMPAKGEISEQESNGDIENSWSQPVYNELACRFPNPYEGFLSRESWSLNTDEYFHAQDLTSTTKSKSSIQVSKPSEALASTSGKPKAPTSTIIRKKSFPCEHCRSVFPKLKERNSHLIDIHGYTRMNRRLYKEPPTATVTTATLAVSIPGIQLSIVSENAESGTDTKPAIVKIEPTQPEEADTKAVIPVVPSSAREFARTKYDSIRAGVYRMLMNFNLSVLKQEKNIEVDKYLFESKSFCCYTCKQDFISVKLFDEHLATHPAECFTCGKKFSRWTYFSIHLKRHLGWKDFGCNVCGKKFVIRSALVEHSRMHTGVAPLKCKHCNKHFRRYSNLTQHMKNAHSTSKRRKKEYVCHCGEVLSSMARFLWHKEIHDSKPKCCHWCSERFIHANSLRRHIRLAHSDKFVYNEPMECPICKQVYSKASIKTHMATHSMDTQHECPICNKSFSTKWNLKIHSWVHANRTAKPFKCEECVKAFVREVDFKNHMYSHKQIKPYTCEYCGCKFIRKYNYMRHRREHHGEKKFSCDLCSRQFHRRYYLIEHRRIHTGERPFLCTICGKSSTTKTNHNKHLKIHHSRDPFTSET